MESSERSLIVAKINLINVDDQLTGKAIILCAQSSVTKRLH